MREPATAPTVIRTATCSARSVCLLRYLWALPNTLIGLVLVAVALVSGGGVQWVDGVVEGYGGMVTWLLRHAVPLQGGARAITFGHVVLGRDRTALNLTRAHERIHVRQYERLGPLFLPVYGCHSLRLYLRGGDPYRDNPLERQAFDATRGFPDSPPVDAGLG